MKMIIVTRNGEEKLVVMAEERNGILRQGENILINSDLLAQAEHEEDMASGALIYDADGWISAEEQKRRHDEFLAKAQALREEAKNIIKEGVKC